MLALLWSSCQASCQASCQTLTAGAQARRPGLLLTALPDTLLAISSPAAGVASSSCSGVCVQDALQQAALQRDLGCLTQKPQVMQRREAPQGQPPVSLASQAA